jgi:hypothetical protein
MYILIGFIYITVANCVMIIFFAIFPISISVYWSVFEHTRHIHGVGSNQFLSVNIGVIRLRSVITTTPFGNYGTSETMFDQKDGKRPRT